MNRDHQAQDLSGNVYVPRGFANPGYLNCYIDKWNGTSWDDLRKGSDGSLFNYDIHSLCTDKSGNVYAAGDFWNTSDKQYVAKWDGISWTELGLGSKGLNATDRIMSLCTDASGNVYAAGFFTNATGYYVAKYPVDKQ